LKFDGKQAAMPSQKSAPQQYNRHYPRTNKQNRDIAISGIGTQRLITETSGNTMDHTDKTDEEMIAEKLSGEGWHAREVTEHDIPIVMRLNGKCQSRDQQRLVALVWLGLVTAALSESAHSFAAAEVRRSQRQNGANTGL